MSFRQRLKDALSALVGSGGGGSFLVAGYQSRHIRRGSREVLEAYNHSPFVRAVAHKVANMVANVRWYAEIDGEPVDHDHPANLFLRRGVPYLDALRRDVFMQLSEDLIGEAAAVIETTREGGMGEPVRMHAFPPSWISEVPRAGRDWYEIRPQGLAAPIHIPRHQVLHRKSIDPTDPYARGSGLGLSLADEIALDEAAAQHMAATLQNHARPDMIITGSKDSPLDQMQVDRLRARFGEHKGPNSAGLPMFTAAPIDVKTISQTFDEMKLTDARRLVLEVVIAVWGIAPELVGQVQNSNRSTIDAADYLVSAHTILPRLRLTAAALNAQVAPMFGEGLEFCFVSPVQEDKEHNLAVAIARPSAFTEDEMRGFAGLDPLPDGLGRVLPRSPLLDYVPVPDADEAVVHERAAPRLTAKTPSSDDIEAALAELDDVTGLSTVVRAVMTDAIVSFGQEAISGAGASVDFNLVDQRIVDFLDTTSSARVTAITETTRGRLRATLSAGVGEGETTDQLVARIRAEIDGATASRAHTIARTEVVRGSNFATTEGHRQAGVTKRQWLATQGAGVGYERDQVRPSHAALDGLTTGIDEPFMIPAGQSNAGRRAMYPGDFGIPEEDINCRCTVLPVFSFTPEQRAAAWKATEDRRASFERIMERMVYREISEQLARVAQVLRDRG